MIKNFSHIERTLFCVCVCCVFVGMIKKNQNKKLRNFSHVVFFCVLLIKLEEIFCGTFFLL